MKNTKYLLGILLCIFSLILAKPTLAVENIFFNKIAKELAQDFLSIGDSLEQQFYELKNFDILGPAPPVTYLEFAYVISELYPNWEYISPYQYATLNDHGGSWMYLAVVQIGYGYDYANMNGSTLPKVYSYPLTNSYGTVYGWINFYEASGYQSGQASVQATSMNYPYNTLYDYLYIQ